MPETLVAIAQAFKISPITAFRKAGLLPPGPDDTINFADWEYLLERLTPDERDEIWQIGVMKVERRQEREGAARAKKFQVGKNKA